MGMTIDNANKLLSVITSTITEDDDCFTIEDENLQVFKETLLTAIDTMHKYQMMQADYKARLKADMVAMLEDLKQDFIAEAYGIEMDCTDYVVNVADIDKIIQQKINELKENNHND